MIDNAAMLERDAQPCTCKHLNVSHGSYTAAGFVGTGNGPCGFNSDCDCQAFEHDPDAFDSAVPGVTICLADACESHPDGRDGFCDFHTENADARWIQGVSA